MERWLPVVGFEDRYEVSDQGRVRSLDIVARNGRKCAGRILSPGIDKTFRQHVTLKINGKQTSIRVHTLVITAFIGPKPLGKECAHGNGNPSDNRLANLQWKTPIENNADKIRHGTQWHGETAPGSKLIAEDIPRIFDLRTAKVPYRKIGFYFGIAESTIRGIFNGKRWGKTVQSLGV